jgi:hypothetical protein
MFPTIKKLSDGFFLNNAPSYDFNHHLIVLGDAQIDNIESGKSFFSGISNESKDDYIKNDLVLNYRFANYKGVFNNIFGELDFVKILAISAAQNSVLIDYSMNDAGSTDSPFISTYKQVSSNLKNYFADTKSNLKIIGNNTVSKLKETPKTILNGIFSENAILGNALLEMSDPKTLATLVENKISNTIDNFTYNTVSKVTNMVLGNFSDRFLNVYGKYIIPGTLPLEKNGPNNMEYNETIQPSQTNSELFKGVTLESDNVFNRGGF